MKYNVIIYCIESIESENYGSVHMLRLLLNSLNNYISFKDITVETILGKKRKWDNLRMQIYHKRHIMV